MAETYINLYDLASDISRFPRSSGTSKTLDKFEKLLKESVDRAHYAIADDWLHEDPEYDRLKRHMQAKRHRVPELAMVTYELAMDSIMANIKRLVWLDEHKKRFLATNTREIQRTLDEVRNNRVHLPFDFDRNTFFVRHKNNKRFFILSFANLAFDSRFNVTFESPSHVMLASHLIRRLFTNYLRKHTKQ